MKSNSSCLVCGVTGNRKIFVSHNVHGRNTVDESECFDVYKCITCGAVYLADLIINEEYYRKYYDDDYYNDLPPASTGFAQKLSLALERFSFKKKASLIRKVIKKEPIRILDVGCGTGKFLQSLDPGLFSRHGVEINADGYEQCLQKGIAAYNLPLQEIDFGSLMFDAVTLIHVLEHLSNPEQVLKTIYSILAPKGILVLSIPNNYSLGYKIGGKNWFHLDSPRHLFVPNIRTINHLAGRANFKTVKIVNEFYDYPLDLFWSVRFSSVKYLIYLLYPLLKILSRESLTIVLKK